MNFLFIYSILVIKKKIAEIDHYLFKEGMKYAFAFSYNLYMEWTGNLLFF